MKKVLIVDDSKTSRKILKNIFEDNNYEVVGEAVNGQEGLDKYQELHPDLVTLDITMPVMDGIETLAKLKEMDPAAKVVMITAAGQKNKMVEAVRLGAEDFVTKPYETSRIIEVLEKLK